MPERPALTPGAAATSGDITVVSADGTGVSTADSPQGGFTFLENFAIRKAP